MNTANIKELQICDTSNIRDALSIIDRNAQGIVFVVDNNRCLVGVTTDGDLRRALLSDATLSTNIREVMNTKFVSRTIDTPDIELMKLLSKDEIRHIPLVDANNILIDYVSTKRLHRIQVLEPNLSGNELEYVSDCIRTNWISSQGTYVKKFESIFSNYCNMEYALAVSNGTVAIHLALVALGIGEGDEVIVPDFTFAATINAVLYTGATPVIVDVDEATWTMSIHELEKAITTKTKAIIPVHIYGHPCHMNEIMEIAKSKGLSVVEDCAEALGSRYNNIPVGSFGDAATFSFFGNKTVTTGEGGMVVIKDEKIAERARMLRDHGMSKKRRYWHEEIGFNYRLTNMQAAIGVAQMERVEMFVQRKREIVKRYNEVFSKIEEFITPPEESWAFSSYWLYTILIKEVSAIRRDELIAKLLLNGIETRPTFYPLHEMPPYKKFALTKTFPVTSHIASCGLSLPSSVTLTDDEIDSIVDALKSIVDVRNLMGVK